MPDLASKDYWNKRAGQLASDRFGLVLVDARAPLHEQKVRELLSSLKHKTALDVACGAGRFSDIFPSYLGIDFSEEMVALARNSNPGKTFEVADGHAADFGKFQVIFEIISLSSLKQTPKEFYEQWKHCATEFVVCCEVDEFYIFPIY